ncbi:AAA family ATPase [Falsibacillus albus]|uniref:Nuclease SbcCD subunit C n=1 Tax=Falsibacillus albus TaxID=2478915 RepID=A0A3L7JTM3_9BACI|nr:AAA family ATPase [Falsibacillus albus]RLQ93625.1 DNA sulfur modification protein DndD [Falsibacillus albus]
MIIQALELQNFRQYYGSQQLEFAYSDEGRIVTVILGDNGRGKTGIYRAIMFALFGDLKLMQDSDEAEITLVNLKALKENPSQTEARVTVKFLHDQETYEISRSLVAGQIGSQVKEQLKDQKLVHLESGKEWTTSKDILLKLQEIVDERVKHYFFFDGERIERLTRVSRQQKDEISMGIKNLLKIDEVLKSRDVLRLLMKKSKKELGQFSKGEYKKALMELEKKELEQLNIQEDEKAKAKLLVKMENDLTLIDQQLKEYETLKVLFRERDELEEQIKKADVLITDKTEHLKIYNEYLPMLAGEDHLYHVQSSLKNELSADNLSGISSDFVAKLIEDMRCICGTDLERNNEQYYQLEQLKSSIADFEENRSAHELQTSIRSLFSYLSKRQSTIDYQLTEIRALQYEKEESQVKLEQLNKRLSSSSEGHVQSLNDQRTSLIKAIAETEGLMKRFKENLATIEEEIGTLNNQLKDLKRKSGVRDQLLDKHDILERSVASMDGLIKRFEAEMIEELESATQQNLNYLLDAAGQSMIKRVGIQKDFSIEVYNAFDQPFLANISQGQRQVLSLSFITALAQTAGGDKALEMPLLMDTPFGRLSEMHQRNLIEYLPQICSQWILLVTDREFGEEEKAIFEESDAIGKYYELESTEPGVTMIREMQPAMKGGI